MNGIYLKIKSIISKAQIYVMQHKRGSIAIALVLSCLALIGVVMAAGGTPSVSTSFTAAQSGRNYMDVGGVWDGSAVDATGDTFTIKISNPQVDDDGALIPMSNVRVTVTLPSGFEYITGSASGVTGITATQSGTTLTFSSFDLNAKNATITYRLKAENTVTSGTKAIATNVLYDKYLGATDQSLPTNTLQVLVQEGASVITKTPANQSKAINAPVDWTVKVTNTGLGALFDVDIDESAMVSGGSGATLQLTGMSITDKSNSAASVTNQSNGKWRINYLGPGDSFTATVTAKVLACGDITNTVSTTDRTAKTLKSTFASVSMDPDTPLVALNHGNPIPVIAMDYSTPTPVSIPITNTVHGTAHNFTLETNLPALNVDVANLASGWSYDNGTGTFTLDTNSGTISQSSNITLTFNAKIPASCATSIGGTVIWRSVYKNDCGDIYKLPEQISTISSPTGAPAISLTKSVSENRLEIGTAGTYTLTLNATNPGNLQSGGNTVVVDTLPEGLDLSQVSFTAPSSTSANINGSEITWTIPNSYLVNTSPSPELSINFKILDDPCWAGKRLINTATATATTAAGCTLNASAEVGILTAFASPVSIKEQKYDITAAPNGTYETGKAHTISGGGRGSQEGEFIPITAVYEFNDDSGGTFTGSSYVDDFGGLSGQTLVTDSLKVSINGSSSVSVPNSSIQSTSGTLKVSLDFMADTGYADTDNLKSQRFVFTYETTVPDSDLGLTGGKLNTSRPVSQFGALTVNASSETGAECADGGVVFRSGDSYTIERAAAQVSVSIDAADKIIEMCQPFNVTVTVSNVNNKNARDVKVTLPFSAGQYEYVPGSSSVSGGFAGATVDETGNPTFTHSGALTADGIIKFKAKLKVSTNVNPSSLNALVDYNDYQTAGDSLGSLPQASGSATPALVKAGNLILTVTPEQVYISNTQAQWTVYVQNTGSGTAVGSTLKTTMPTGLTLDEAETNAQNAALPSPPGNVSISGTDLTWNLGNIASGDVKKVIIVANVTATGGASIGSSTNITAEWGCDGAIGTTTIKINPKFTIPDGQMQVVHDSRNSSFSICNDGTVTIIVRNTGFPHVKNVVVTEELVPGISIKAGSVEYSTDGSTWVSGTDPTDKGNDTYEWKWDNGAAGTLGDVLRDIAPTSVGSGEVRIRFNITTTYNLNQTHAFPEITASAKGEVSNGKTVTSNATPYPLPIYRPDITVEKVGRNITVNPSGAFEKTVYGGTNDVIEWRISISNSSSTYAKDAQKVWLKEIFAGSNGTATTISGPGIAGTVPITNNTEMEIASIPKGTTNEYIVTETLGNTNVNADNTVKVEWACTSALNERYTWPSNNTDTALLVMEPDVKVTQIATNKVTPVANNAVTNNGRVMMTATIKNTGGPIDNITFTVTPPGSMILDNSPTDPVGFVTNDTTGNIAGEQITTVAATGTSPYTFTFNNTGRLRNGQTVTVKYYLIQKSDFDITANGGATVDGTTDISAFEYPEDTSNGLDPTLPAGGTGALQADYKWSDGTTNESKLAVSASIDPLTPDLDMTVDNSPRTVQRGQTYNFSFPFTITNNGDDDSVAENITFSLPYVGGAWSNVTVDGVAYAGAVPISGTLAKGSSKVITVQGTATVPAAPTVYDLRLIAQVNGILKNQNGVVVDNYSFDRAAPLITDDVDVSGYVYIDANFNAHRENNEVGPGTTPPMPTQLYAKLIGSDPHTAMQVVEVDPTTGYYVFNKVSDTITSYSIIIDDNNIAADVTPMDMPTGYIGTEYPDLERKGIVVKANSVYDQNFGLVQGTQVSGTVFKDTGTVPNNGKQEGDEKGIAGVNIKVTNADGSHVYATATTDNNGSYSVYLPGAPPGVLKVVETNPTGYISTGADLSSISGTSETYDINTDAVSFTLISSKASYDGINFGDVPQSTFINDGNRTVVPGGAVFFPHVFTAGTAGTVTFSTSNTSSPNDSGWTHLVYSDDNHNGVLDPGEPLIPASITVAAGEKVFLIIKENAPANVTNGAQDVIEITANFALTGTSVTETLKRNDVANVNTQTELNLEKKVDKTDVEKGDTITYTITYKNISDQPITNVVINDFVPAFTTFVSASAPTLPASLTLGTIDHPTEPAGGNPGGIGAIKWIFGGQLAPGQSGDVEFTVKVDD